MRRGKSSDLGMSPEPEPEPESAAQVPAFVHRKQYLAVQAVACPDGSLPFSLRSALHDIIAGNAGHQPWHRPIIGHAQS